MPNILTSLTALAFLLTIASAGAQPTGSSVAATGVRTWPALDGWSTMMIPKQPGRDVVCMTSYIPGPISSTQAMLSITLNSSSTHFYASFSGPDFPAGTVMRISGDGVAIVDAPILSQETLPNGNHMVMGDLPGSTLVNTLGPALMRSNTMQVDFGGHRFTARLGDFRKVAAQIKDCALALQKMYPHP